MINTKRLYTLATVNGFSHSDVKEYISFEFNKCSTKDLTKEEYNQLINYLDKDTQTMADKVLALGFFGKAPRRGSPSFVKGGISIKVDDAVQFLHEHANEKGYVNIDLLENKNDPSKWNAFLNDWKPEKKSEPTQTAPEEPAF
jgi:hypothetical protein